MICERPGRAPAERGRRSSSGACFDESAEPAARLRGVRRRGDRAGAPSPARATVAAPLAEALLAEHRRALPRWLKLLGPAAPLLAAPLGSICRDTGRTRDPTTQSTAAEALADVLQPGGSPSSSLRPRSTQFPRRRACSCTNW